MSLVGSPTVGLELALASFVFVHYDYLTTFDGEIRHFWQDKSWNLSRILFFWNRYLPISITTFSLILEVWYKTNTNLTCTVLLMNVLGMATVRGTIITRLYHLLAQEFVKHLLVAAHALCTAVATSLLALSFGKETSVPGFWIVPLAALDLLIGLIVVFRTAENFRALKNVSMMKALGRDGGLIYIVIYLLTAFVLPAVVFVVRPANVDVSVLVNLMLAVQSACTSHVLLDVYLLARTFTDPFLIAKGRGKGKVGVLAFVRHMEDLDEDILDSSSSILDEVYS